MSGRKKSLKDLYIEMLEDSYDSEHQIVKALPKLAKAAASPKLKHAFETHLKETEGQIETLDEVFELLAMKPKRKTCEATKGLVEEGDEMIKEKDEMEEGVLDAGLIGCAQKVEHYEIASYGTLCEFARLLGFEDQRDLLSSILEEEKTTDKKLSALAGSQVNPRAKAA
jgi:ferritin-like metal-binding protein YciE